MRFTRARYSNRVPSPRDRRRACLCDDGRTYSTKCCEGGFQNQGIGSLSGGESSIIIPPEVEAIIPPPPPVIADYNKYSVSKCTGGGFYNVFTSLTLTPLSVYEMTLSNGASGCFTVLTEESSADILITSIDNIPFDGCSDCETILDPEGDPAPTCTDKVVVIQICNDNAAVDDNFDVLLNNTKIGEVDLNQDARIGSFFIGSTNTDISITGLEDGFNCAIDDMVVYRFDPSLLYEGDNTLFMKNTQNNGNGNAGSIGIRNYSLDGNDLSDPCDIQDLEYAGPSGNNFVKQFTFNTCCATLDCSQITFSGFSISQSGTVTQGTADIGTITTVSPSSVAANTSTSPISVDLSVIVEAPEPYLNAGETVFPVCTVSVNQPGLTLTRYTAYWSGTKDIRIQTHHNGTTKLYTDIKGGAVVFSYSEPTGDPTSWTAGATDITLAGFDTATYFEGDPDVGLDPGIFTFTHYSVSAFTTVQSGTGTGSVQISPLSLQNVSGSYVPIAPHNPAANGLKAYASPYASNAPVSSGLGTLVSDGYYTIANSSIQVRVSSGVITVMNIP